MAITVEIPSALRRYTHGNADLVIDTIECPCASIDGALDAVRSEWPGVMERIMTEQGELRPHVNVFVNGENIRYADGLRTPIEDPSTITILAAISGG
ncbi:MAG TPA: MoaD/ThiS family protein [Gemmatimonadaceae bacterium]